ncbi:HTTM domain-containing protein [Bacteroidales bacterium AH-315-I05]|nr:HTTM domain-containing protein [Bacteroidales bacterium AH-315-I05]
MLFKPVNPSSLGLFRVFYGGFMIYEFAELKEYVLEYLLQTKFYFTYDFFHWIKPLPAEYMQFAFDLSLIAAFLVMMGWMYRISQVFIFLSWTYIFLLDKGHYNNHYYLYSLLSFLLIFIDAHKTFSIISFWKNTKNTQTTVAAIPYWQLLCLQLQIVIVYFYGGIAKLNADWLKGYPMKLWLVDDWPFPQWLNDFLATDFAAYLYSYGGLAFDLIIPLMLFHKKARWWAIPALLFFHVSNHFFWNIGSFPWFMLAAILLFFDIGKRKAPKEFEPYPMQMKKLVAGFFMVYFSVQAVYPLRQFFYPNNPAWSGEGQFFSWRMMLVDTVDGIRFKIKDKKDPNYFYVDMGDYVTFKQFRKGSRTPKSLLKFAHHLRNIMIENGATAPIVKMEIYKSVNARPYALLVDTSLNYAEAEYNLMQPAYWIMPFNKEDEPGTGTGNLDLDLSKTDSISRY